MDDFGSLASLTFVVALLVGFVILLALREVACWYFKINKISKCLDEQRETQKTMLAELQAINKNLLLIAGHFDDSKLEAHVATEKETEAA